MYAASADPARHLPEEVPRRRSRRRHIDDVVRLDGRPGDRIQHRHVRTCIRRDELRQSRCAEDRRGADGVQVPVLRSADGGPRLLRLVGRRELRARAMGRAAGVVRRHPAPRSAQRHDRPLRPARRAHRSGHRRRRIHRRRSSLAAASSAHPAMGGGTEVAVRLGGPLLRCSSTHARCDHVPDRRDVFHARGANRRRALWAGIIVAIVFAAVTGVGDVPIEPYFQRMLFGFGADRRDRR